MAFEDLNLQNLRQLALVYIGENEAQNHFGTKIDFWLNAGVRKMWEAAEGVQDVAVLQTVVGDRYVPLPVGFLRERQVLLNGESLRFRTVDDVDFLSTGNSRPGWYCFWGKPNTKVLLGPKPPDSVYDLTVMYYRTPHAMVENTDVPELPAQWRDAPVFYAAAQACIADADLTTAQAHLQLFSASQQSFHEWLVDESRVNPLTVGYTAYY